MITGLSHATVFVLDQDKAKDFYTKKLGFEVRNDVTMGDEVEGGGAGFRWLTVGAKGKPAVVVLDIMMPKLDGMKVMRELQSDDKLRGTPVILLSAKATSLDIELGLKAGAADYVTKPCDPIELVERVRSLLAKTG